MARTTWRWKSWLAFWLGFIVVGPELVSPRAAHPQPSRVIKHIDPKIRRFIIAHLKPDFYAEGEKDHPTFVVAAPLLLKNGTRATVVLLRGTLCSPTGNCPLFVVVPQGRTYKVVDYAQGAGAHAPVRVLAHFTKGYPDLTVWQHDSAFDYYEVRLWFNGHNYVEGEKRNGTMQDLRRYKSEGEVASRDLPPKPEGKLLIGEERGERLYR